MYLTKYDLEYDEAFQDVTNWERVLLEQRVMYKFKRKDGIYLTCKMKDTHTLVELMYGSERYDDEFDSFLGKMFQRIDHYLTQYSQQQRVA